MGRLTRILLSFAQFEREIISERARDKLSAARRKGKWIGGHPVLGYDIDPKGGKLIINPDEAQRVLAIYRLYLKNCTLSEVWDEVRHRGWCSVPPTGRSDDNQIGAVWVQHFPARRRPRQPASAR